MSLVFLLAFVPIVNSGTLDETYFICWSLFAIADALWCRTILGVNDNA